MNRPSTLTATALPLGQRVGVRRAQLVLTLAIALTTAVAVYVGWRLHGEIGALAALVAGSICWAGAASARNSDRNAAWAQTCLDCDFPGNGASDGFAVGRGGCSATSKWTVGRRGIRVLSVGVLCRRVGRRDGFVIDVDQIVARFVAPDKGDELIHGKRPVRSSPSLWSRAGFRPLRGTAGTRLWRRRRQATYSTAVSTWISRLSKPKGSLSRLISS